MKVLSIVGARPQFVKLAPITDAATHAGVDHVIVHTGQHYDPMLSDVFFEDLGIPNPDFHLGVGSGSHGVQTGAILAGLDPILEQTKPDWVVAYGDTNSTLAGALSAVKQHFPIAHLEAGLRSFNRRMPEEINRILTDHAADLLLAPTEVAMSHLAREGLGDRAVLVGDVMTDVLYRVRDQVVGSEVSLLERLGLRLQDYYLATIHRAENTDDPARLSWIIHALSSLDRPVILLAHPRLVARAQSLDLSLNEGSMVSHTPLTYPDLIAAVLSSVGVVTDSGGLQKEAFLLGVPCATVREQTEWVETVDLGWNRLVDSHEELVAALHRQPPEPTDAAPYGDGHASERVINELLRRCPSE
jgi:UDP-N-acetylglucosamine 2-epimerase (non-hydrolysing)